jgi:long-chain acyl-CoA synthetase
MTMTIRQTITEVVEHNQHRIFLVDAVSGRELTYGEFHIQACALAAELHRRGLQKGARVGVIIPNCSELAVLYFACMYLGAVIVPINPTLSKSEVQFILESCKPSFVMATEVIAKSLKQLHQNICVLATASDAIGAAADPNKIVIDHLQPAPPFVSLQTAEADHPADLMASLLADLLADDLLVIMYTSGTSAKPKGLAHKIGSMFRNAAAFARAQNIDQNSRFYLTLSMAYMGGFYNLLVLPFLCGASVVVDHVFDARASLHFWEKAKKHQINTLWMAPTVLSILLRMDRGRTGEQFCRASVRHAFVGFAPLPLKVKDEFELRYGVQLIENYGLSETLFVTARSHAGHGNSGYVGEPLPGVAIRIVTDAQDCAGVDQADVDREGEVQILTPDLMAGYLNAAGELLEVQPSNWFPTGDIGRLDAQGSLSITGRKKDIIIRGGINISPAAIEDSLLQVRGVSEVAVVSIPHELYGEDIVAVLKLELGLDLDSLLPALAGHAKENLAAHQQPARYIAIDELPRTASGKVQKARLRELVAEKFQLSSSLRKPEPERAIAACS